MNIRNKEKWKVNQSFTHKENNNQRNVKTENSKAKQNTKTKKHNGNNKKTKI